MTRVRKTRAFDPVAQEQYRLSPATIFTNKSQEKLNPFKSLDAEDKLEPEYHCEQATTITTARWSLG
jgi:hypothetical protein